MPLEILPKLSSFRCPFLLTKIASTRIWPNPLFFGLNQGSNHAVIWDRIIKRKEDAHVVLEYAINKYAFREMSKSFKWVFFLQSFLLFYILSFEEESVKEGTWVLSLIFAVSPNGSPVLIVPFRSFLSSFQSFHLSCETRFFQIFSLQSGLASQSLKEIFHRELPLHWNGTLCLM